MLGVCSHTKSHQELIPLLFLSLTQQLPRELNSHVIKNVHKLCLYSTFNHLNHVWAPGVTNLLLRYHFLFFFLVMGRTQIFSSTSLLTCACLDCHRRHVTAAAMTPSQWRPLMVSRGRWGHKLSVPRTFGQGLRGTDIATPKKWEMPPQD